MGMRAALWGSRALTGPFKATFGADGQLARVIALTTASQGFLQIGEQANQPLPRPRRALSRLYAGTHCPPCDASDSSQMPSDSSRGESKAF